jgi:hypothetical protein
MNPNKNFLKNEYSIDRDVLKFKYFLLKMMKKFDI